ncbi:MAG: hypothetical protein MI919_40930, partial [Holophagales bacterium]|nr:hypothetical protein [Holophagales bacterium]
MPSPSVIELVRDALSEDGGRLEVTVSGACMAPLIRHGDRVSIAPVDPSTSPPGALLLAVEKDGTIEKGGAVGEARLVCHRLLDRDGAGLVLGGDATRRRERHLPEDVLGRVVAVRRGQRRLGLDARPWRILGTFSTGLRHPRWRRPGEL